MTRFTVVWNADLEAEFANSWLASDSQTRAVLTETANWIDRYLAEDADTKGQWRPELSARSIVVPLLASPAHVSVTFLVQPDDRQVRVLSLVFRRE
jgi:hypothetical protein